MRNFLRSLPHVWSQTAGLNYLLVAVRYMSNRRRRLLNGTDYLKSKSGYAGRVTMPNMMREMVPTKVRCAHILLKHKGSRNPINRNTNQRITRTKEEAIAEMTRHREEIMAAEIRDREFRKKATNISECTSAQNGGDLGFFTRNEMQGPFSTAAFLLAVGEVSGLVHTESGIHLIYRIA
ncbi:peptidyl-prolyl cis-trans isomerase, putative [Babesia bigemina]|uniref:Peptidyl-prolyl cis-trans isomerase n=1 Tax=Babesia bigemina TaxID=5866 RepID=A0A061DBC8_BABBI|nr:peptidyl-prolyl cis-trans isomerase, putative [Babesia bigemina]CDR97828.1 peptidyl-prolyl cis-trans isomerase, putative [Babesia bigemina]|eukprot:XP_012770014.1 peptidyl-prolyl cis-trans isomerase, putative [Babesia bigemina]